MIRFTLSPLLSLSPAFPRLVLFERAYYYYYYRPSCFPCQNLMFKFYTEKRAFIATVMTMVSIIALLIIFKQVNKRLCLL